MTNPEAELTDEARTSLEWMLQEVMERFGVIVHERVLVRIESALSMIAQNPNIGHRRSDITSDTSVRFWSVGPTVIAYTNEGQRVLVLFIQRAELDWMAKFGVSSE